MPTQIRVARDELAAFCKRHNIRLLSFFGSVVRHEFRPDSDIDVLIEFEDGYGPGFIGLHRIETELSGLLGGRRLDLVNPKFLNPRIREQVLAEAEVQYAKEWPVIPRAHAGLGSVGARARHWQVSR
jgi:hypothetical protein